VNEYPLNAKFLRFAIFLLLPLAASAQTADEIVNKSLAARGGADKIKAIQSERVSGHVTFGPGLEGSLVAELKRPHKLHVEIVIEGQKIIRVYDGKSAGWVVNPFAENKDAQPMSAEDLKSVSEESDFDGPFIDYRAKGNQIELVGKEELEGKSAYRIKLTNKNGDVRFYLFDATSFLPAKWEETRVVEGKETPWESFFSDYRTVNGVKYAFQIDSDSPGTDLKQTVVAEKIEINAQIDETRFAKPAVPEAPAASPSPASAPPPD
jgi:outer membrane lipoprotein-sorting protein